MKRRSPSSASTARVRLALGRRTPRAPQLGEELGRLLAHLGDRTLEVGPVVADGGRATLDLAREQERGKRLRHVVEDAFAALLLGLDRLPALAHAPCRARLGVAEDVWVPAHELFVYGPGDLVEVPFALLLEEQREEEHLEEEVAELVEELRGIVRERGVGDLVRLLDRVRDDRASRLLAIPGALGPEAPGQLTELAERAVCAHAADATRRSSSSAGRGGRVRRLEPGGVLDLVLVLLLDVRDPLVDRGVLRLGLELRADLVLDLGERGDRAGLDVRERLDQVVAELRLDRLRQLVGVEREGSLVERGDGLALGDGELAARVLRAGVDRVRLGECREVAAVDELGADPVGVGLGLHEYVANGARLRDRVVRPVLLVVALDVRIGDLRIGGHLLVDPLGEEL